MAQNNLILAGSLLLLLSLSYGVLKAEKLDDPGIQGTKMMSGHKNALEGPSDGVVHNAYRTNDVRPTTHGHSPGAGHSTGPVNNGYN
ncbi:hypothetical protein F3Y22_tig00116997pilonHSYRG01011 [Hibiscus syriacus]|uniref:Uncharacterized protein n=1 Tax=Hibiscus syriacus TaxID=106335 RepID=A0A6A2XF46_HIBSY|nr:hypothetical protein F3Y22_tig00116997pilonHSYRG01011 [Hibiscus syriacus]